MSRFLTLAEKAASKKQAKELKLCRWCGLDVKRFSSRRSSFCSDECVHEFRLRSDASYVRHYIAKRDKFICQLCGLECRGFVRRLRRYVQGRRLELPFAGSNELYAKQRRELEEEYFNSLGMEYVNTNSRSTFYDIDHIIPVIEGGHQCGEENLRLLCLSCHRKETAKLKKRLAEKPKQ